MRPLFSHWNDVAGRLSAATSIALCLDFDGTLARLHRRPEEVILDGPARRTLAALARSPRFRVWIITGRRRADVRERVRVPGVQYLGLHGWESRASNGLSEQAQHAVECLQALVAPMLMNHQGMWIEDKQHALTIHHETGLDPQELLPFRNAIDGAVASFAGLLRLEEGRNIWEIVPVELGNKGAAVKCLLGSLAIDTVPVYVGDDRADEPAFAALRHGITARVGRTAHSNAEFWLAGVREVHRLLFRLKNLLA